MHFIKRTWQKVHWDTTINASKKAKFFIESQKKKTDKRTDDKIQQNDFSKFNFESDHITKHKP